MNAFVLGNAALMPNDGTGVMLYRRSTTPGATYFFTVVTFERRPILCDPENVALLREAFRTVKRGHPFQIDAFVLLPDHLHCLWTLPEGDADYPMRWSLIKGYFSLRGADEYKRPASISRAPKREQTVWQRRYWEHQVRDERDFERHCDYIHWNPVKHGYATVPADWAHSSFRRYVRAGIYANDWGGAVDLGDFGGFGE